MLGTVLPHLEDRSSSLLPSSLDAYLFTGGADAARSVLETVAGSLVTVTSLTFSLTVVTLQLASSQFSPRLLRTFTRDLVVQSTLGLFLATFGYTLAVLRTVRTESSTRAEFVPGVSITVAYLFTIASVIALIVFLAHLALTIRVESMLRSVHEDASATLERELQILDEKSRTEQVRRAPLVLDGPSWHLLAGSSGFLVQIREADLLEAACGAGVVVTVRARPGDSIVEGTPVGTVVRWSGAPLVDEAHDQAAVAARLRACLVTGFERTAVQDVGLGLRQLVDVAVKALSPGINDPTTAVHTLGHCSALLGQLALRDLGPRVLRDDDENVVRVIAGAARPGRTAPPRRRPAVPLRREEPAVMKRLFALLRELAWVSTTDQREVVRTELDRLRRLVHASDLDERSTTELHRALHWWTRRFRPLAGRRGRSEPVVTIT